LLKTLEMSSSTAPGVTTARGPSRCWWLDDESAADLMIEAIACAPASRANRERADDNTQSP
jgi:hypothetical protein